MKCNISGKSCIMQMKVQQNKVHQINSVKSHDSSCLDIFCAELLCWLHCYTLAMQVVLCTPDKEAITSPSAD